MRIKTLNGLSQPVRQLTDVTSQSKWSVNRNSQSVSCSLACHYATLTHPLIHVHDLTSNKAIMLT